jgi:hypothetical protein
MHKLRFNRNYVSSFYLNDTEETKVITFVNAGNKCTVLTGHKEPIYSLIIH